MTKNILVALTLALASLTLVPFASAQAHHRARTTAVAQHAATPATHARTTRGAARAARGAHETHEATPAHHAD
jgi:hypothetical protein